MRRALALGLAAFWLSWPLAAPAALPGGASLDVSTGYGLRWAQQHAGADTRDQDLTTLVGLEVPRAGLERLSFSGLIWYGKDLDGTSEESPFKDNLDTFSNRDDLRVYRAALTYALPWGHSSVTGGRQAVWGAESVLFDGGLLHLSPTCRHFTLEVFGGGRVSHDSDPDPDAVYGANLELRPHPGTRLEVRDVYLIDNSFEAGLYQDLWNWGHGRAVYRMIDRDPRDLTAGLDVTPWEAGEARFTFVRKLADPAEGDDDFDYDYTSAHDDAVDNLELGPLYPYSDTTLEFRQGLFGVLGLGARLRHHVVAEEYEDARNASFDEGTALFDLAEWPWKGLRLNAEATRWVEERERGDRTEEELWGFLGAVEQAFGGHAAGASFYRQAYDADGGVRDSRGFELWARARLAKEATLTLRYERGVDDLYREGGFDAVHSLTCRLDLGF